MLHSLTSLAFRSLLRTKRGSVTVMMAAVLFTMVICMGVAIDMSRGNALQSKLGNALDAAGLAAGNAAIADLNGGASFPTQVQSDAQAAAQTYFNANFPSGTLGSTPNITVTVTMGTTAAGASDGTLTVTSQATMPNNFMSIVGQPTQTITKFTKIGLPTKGICGGTYNTCTVGAASGSNGSTAWNRNGLNGGSGAACSTGCVVNGVCGAPGGGGAGNPGYETWANCANGTLLATSVQTESWEKGTQNAPGDTCNITSCDPTNPAAKYLDPNYAYYNASFPNPYITTPPTAAQVLDWALWTIYSGSTSPSYIIGQYQSIIASGVCKGSCTWTCEGGSGGTNATCSTTTPVDGQCGIYSQAAYDAYVLNFPGTPTALCAIGNPFNGPIYTTACTVTSCGSSFLSDNGTTLAQVQTSCSRPTNGYLSDSACAQFIVPSAYANTNNCTDTCTTTESWQCQGGYGGKTVNCNSNTSVNAQGGVQTGATTYTAGCPATIILSGQPQLG